ncbi:MAG: hypothetical protein ACYDH9_15990 [Limisphaerales bacterium]
MAQPRNPITVDLPEGLRGQFAQVSRRLWTAETVVAACCAGGGLIVSYLAVFVSDRFWDTPVWVRTAAAVAGLSAVIGAGGWWAKRWIFNRRDLRALAIRVQRHYRRLGDRLLGIVELADERARPAHFSPALYQAAIQQVAAEAAAFDFRQTVSVQPAKSSATMLLGLLGLGLLPLLLLPGAGWNAFRRWLAPAAAIERYTLVTLEDVPRQQIVAHGEPFEVEGTVRYRSFWRPTRAFGQYDRESRIEAGVQGDRVRFRVPGQTQRGVLKLQVGDGQQRVTILPTYRPSLQQLSATITLPQYLGYSPLDEDIPNGSLSVLEGSRVSFQGKTSRALTSARVQLDEKPPQPLAVQGGAFSSESLDLAGVSRCVFTWRDQLGLENGAPGRLAIQARNDAPPEPELPDLARESTILAGEVVEVKAVARDDFGVRDLGLNWERASDWQSTNTSARQTFRVQAESHQQKELAETFRFSPALLNIPADSTIELQAYARDFFPGRQPVTTPVYRIYVLGNAQHAEMVRARLESLMSRLEEVTRLQEKITGDTRDLKNAGKPATDETAQRIGETAEDQSRNAANLDQLTKEGGKVLWEALKNPTFSEQTLRDWSKKFGQMQQLAQGPMPQASQTLKSAGQSAQSRADKLERALKTEEEILAALAQMQKRVNEGLDQLQALTLAQRLRKVGSTEQGIAAHLQQIVPETIGLAPNELPAQFQKAQTSLAGEQDNAQKESEVLRGEISRFFERTQRQNYGQVNREMTEHHTGDELDRIRGLIHENISMDAMQNLATWSRRFSDWADKLEPPPASSAGGGGGGGGGDAPDNQLMKELLALLRLREGETTLRQQTRLVEQQKTDPAAYAGGARLLSNVQQKLNEDLGAVQKQNPLAEIEAPLEEARTAMQQNGSLLQKPQTDQAADREETRTIELLSDAINLINEQAQRRNGSPSSGSGDEMAFLLQMMALGQQPGMGMNPNGGGNTAGGTTDRPTTPLAGDPTGKRAESRDVRKASGAGATLPTEFRDALENYFHGIEQKAP